MKLYTTYEEPLKGRTFTEKQMYEVYRDMADKNEYPDFECWFSDMLKSGVFEEMEETSVLYNLDSEEVQVFENPITGEITCIFEDGTIKAFSDYDKAITRLEKMGYRF